MTEVNRRYSLILPEEIFEELGTVSKEKYKTKMELIRSYIVLGLLLEGKEVFIKEGGKKVKLLIL